MRPVSGGLDTAELGSMKLSLLACCIRLYLKDLTTQAGKASARSL